MMEASGASALPADDGTLVPTDEQLLARIAALDTSAIEALYDRYGSMAFGLATRITGDAALAEDVVQDAFLGVWRSADRYLDSRASAKTTARPMPCWAPVTSARFPSRRMECPH